MTDVKDSMPVLERFVVVMSYHTNRSMMPEMFCIFAHQGRNLENLRAVGRTFPGVAGGGWRVTGGG